LFGAFLFSSSPLKTGCDIMAKTPTKIEVLQEGDERFLLRTFADGSEDRRPIVKLPRKPPRFPPRRVTFDKSRKKGF
jgi:hypothetical protein